MDETFPQMINNLGLLNKFLEGDSSYFSISSRLVYTAAASLFIISLWSLSKTNKIDCIFPYLTSAIMFAYTSHDVIYVTAKVDNIFEVDDGGPINSVIFLASIEQNFLKEIQQGLSILDPESPFGRPPVGSNIYPVQVLPFS